MTWLLVETLQNLSPCLKETLKQKLWIDVYLGGEKKLFGNSIAHTLFIILLKV